MGGCWYKLSVIPLTRFLFLNVTVVKEKSWTDFYQSAVKKLHRLSLQARCHPETVSSENSHHIEVFLPL